MPSPVRITEANLYDSLGPGKFEGHGGRLIAELYDIGLDTGADAELGDAQDIGFYEKFDGVKIPGVRRKIYAVLMENSNGNLYLSEYKTGGELRKAWEKLEREYEHFEEGRGD